MKGRLITIILISNVIVFTYCDYFAAKYGREFIGLLNHLQFMGGTRIVESVRINIIDNEPTILTDDLDWIISSKAKFTTVPKGNTIYVYSIDKYSVDKYSVDNSGVFSALVKTDQLDQIYVVYRHGESVVLNEIEYRKLNINDDWVDLENPPIFIKYWKLMAFPYLFLIILNLILCIKVYSKRR